MKENLGFPSGSDREGHGNPLQYSCLENPRDGGAWWAALYGVAQSRTRLKRLSSSSNSSDSKEPACNAGDLGSASGLGRSSGGRHGNLLQYSCLENSRGQRSVAGYGPGGYKESDMTERLSTQIISARLGESDSEDSSEKFKMDCSSQDIS